MILPLQGQITTAQMLQVFFFRRAQKAVSCCKTAREAYAVTVRAEGACSIHLPEG